MPLDAFAWSVLPSAALVLAGFATGLIIQRVVLARLVLLARRTSTPLDDLVVAVIRGPVVAWSTILGIYLATEIAPMDAGTARLLQRVLFVLVVVSISWTVARLATHLVEHAAGRVTGRIASASLLGNVVQVAIMGLGGLIVLQTLGVSITPLLTALGVGGLAVGLALQDTLANFFAGIHILTSRQVRPGDFVRLSSGEEGYVQDVTWRYTTIRQLPNNLTIVPNAQLASAVITNYYLPETDLAVLVPVGVSYDSDLQRVEQVTTAVGREIMREVPGGVAEFDPFIRYNTFADSSITFTVILRGREVVDQHLIKHEFIKRLHRRYREEGIEIPFPIRTVHLRPAEQAHTELVRGRIPRGGATP